MKAAGNDRIMMMGSRKKMMFDERCKQKTVTILLVACNNPTRIKCHPIGETLNGLGNRYLLDTILNKARLVLALCPTNPNSQISTRNPR